MTSYAACLFALGLIVAVAGFGGIGIILGIVGFAWELFATNAAR